VVFYTATLQRNINAAYEPQPLPFTLIAYHCNADDTAVKMLASKFLVITEIIIKHYNGLLVDGQYKMVKR